MNKTAASIVIGDQVVSMDESTLEIFLASIDIVLNEGFLTSHSDDEIRTARETRSLIAFAQTDSETSQQHPHQLPLARSTRAN